MKLAFVLVIAFLFSSCKKESQVEEVKKDSVSKPNGEATMNTDNSQNSFDWAGIYRGVTPCASCEGIETELVLSTDLTFTLKTKYLGKGDGKIFEENGNFVWDTSGGTISLQGLYEKPSQYKVGENRLFQLDIKGMMVTGALAEKYILKK